MAPRALVLILAVCFQAYGFVLVRPVPAKSMQRNAMTELSEVATEASVLAAVAAVAGWLRVDSKVTSMEKLMETKLEANAKDILAIGDRVTADTATTKEKIGELQLQLKDDKVAIQEQLSRLEIDLAKSVAITVQKASVSEGSGLSLQNFAMPMQRRAEAGGFFNSYAPLPPQQLWDGRRLINPQDIKPFLPTSFLPETASSSTSE